MDIMLLGPKSLKLKGKKSSIVINPASDISKTEAEAIILFGEYGDKNLSKVEGQRIVVVGQGEYEVSGTKISATRQDGKLVCLIDIDNIKVLVGEGASIEKVFEKIENCNIVVVDANSEFDYGILPKIEPNVILIYGEKKNEAGKSLGKDQSEKMTKFSATLEKLPEDLQVFLLG